MTAIRESCVDDLVTTVTNVTIANGFTFDIQEVVRGQSIGRHLKAFPGIYVFELREDKGEGEIPNELIKCMLHITLIVWSRDPASNKNIININQLIADIKKAVLQDRTRGGFAVTTRVVANRHKITDALEPYGAAQMSVDIIYRHKREDPSVAA